MHILTQIMCVDSYIYNFPYMDPECGIADHLCVHDQIMFLHITYRSRHCWTGVALQGAGCSCDTEFLRNSQLSDARFWCTEMAIYNYDGDHHSILHFFDILYSIPLYCTFVSHAGYIPAQTELWYLGARKLDLAGLILYYCWKMFHPSL